MNPDGDTAGRFRDRDLPQISGRDLLRLGWPFGIPVVGMVIIFLVVRRRPPS